MNTLKADLEATAKNISKLIKDVSGDIYGMEMALAEAKIRLHQLSGALQQNNNILEEVVKFDNEHDDVENTIHLE